MDWDPKETIFFHYSGGLGGKKISIFRGSFLKITASNNKACLLNRILRHAIKQQYKQINYKNTPTKINFTNQHILSWFTNPLSRSLRHFYCHDEIFTSLGPKFPAGGECSHPDLAFGSNAFIWKICCNRDSVEQFLLWHHILFWAI